MTTRIATYDTFEQATRHLSGAGYEADGSDNMLGHLYRKGRDSFRLVKNDWTGKLELTARNF